MGIVLLMAAVLLHPSSIFSSDAPPDRTGYLGIAVRPVDEEVARSLGLTEARGAWIRDVQEGSPAAKAGLKANDVVIRFDGTDLTQGVNLGFLVQQIQPGSKVRMTVLRDGKPLRLSAVVGARQGAADSGSPARIDLPGVDFLPFDMPSPALRWHSRVIGIEYEGVDSQLAEYFGVRQGVLIRFVRPASPAQRAGLKAGDIVVKVDGKTIAGPREMTMVLQQQDGFNMKLSLNIVRDRKTQALVLTTAAPALHDVNAPGEH